MLRPDVEPALGATIDRAMAHDPSWRFPSADAMRAALAGVPQPNSVRPPTLVLAEPLPTSATLAVAVPTRHSRTRGIVALAAVLLAIVLAAVLIFFETGSPPSAPSPATTSTSLLPLPSPSSVLPPPPPPPPPPVQVDREPPGKKKDHGNGKKEH
jgi:serine/threonine-protein kinase